MQLEIAVFEGDGIGPEVMAPTLALLERLAPEAGVGFAFKTLPAGAGCYRDTGEALPEASLEAAREADAILLSAMGLPDVRYPDGTEISPQIALRMAFGLYAGVRPVRTIAGAPGPLAGAPALDFVIIRESTEGLFASHGRGQVEADRARETLEITRATSEKLFDAGFALARRRREQGRGPGLVHCVDKANVFKAFAFFRAIFRERAALNPDLAAETAYVDATALWMVQRPGMFDVIVTENMFGDILSDLGAGLMGGLGVAPSADIGDEQAVFQPCHGSAPDIAGKGVANPCAMILSAAMMLDWLGERRGHAGLCAAAARLERAVDAALADPAARTADLGGRASTSQAAAAVAAALTAAPAGA